jgi:hypothetical protein
MRRFNRTQKFALSLLLLLPLSAWAAHSIGSNSACPTCPCGADCGCGSDCDCE